MAGLCIAALLIGLAPAWWNISKFDLHNRTNVSLQAQSDTQEAPQIDHLLDYVRAHPQGRVYAGSPTNWGADFTVGAVPVFKYLESKDVDEVGYTLRTASLMTDPEYFFDDTNPGDYPLFGIGYLIIPESMSPPVRASKVGCSGQYCLWSLPQAGYIHVYDTTGVLEATRANVGTQSESLLESALPDEDRDLTVAFNGSKAATPTAPDATALIGAPGHVVIQSANLANGRARAVVSTKRRATVVLSASVRPGLDGHGRRTPRTDRHRGAGPRRRGRRARSTHGGLQLYGVRVLQRVVRVDADRAGRAGRRSVGLAPGAAPRQGGRFGEQSALGCRQWRRPGEERG